MSGYFGGKVYGHLHLVKQRQLKSQKRKVDYSGLEFRQINLSYEESYSGHVIEPKNLLKQQTKHQNTVEYIKGKSFSFISLNKSINLKFSTLVDLNILFLI